jgi:hypothetical protein
MSRKMLSIAVLASFAFLAAGSVEARPLGQPQDNLPGSVASFQELWTRASSSLATIFQKDTSSADPNGLKRQGVRQVPVPVAGTKLPKPRV